MSRSLVLLKLVLLLAPVVPAERKEGQQPVPDLVATTQFGSMTQSGKVLTIQGTYWSATGEIREDGTIYLLWITRGGRIAPGVYRQDGDTLVGNWGWVDDVEIALDGELIGQTCRETLYLTRPK